MGLIDKNALVDNLELLARYEDKFRQSVILGVVGTIRATKEIDAVVVTRCKDCRYFKMYKCRMGYSSYNDFCSYGEPKEDAVNPPHT